MINELISLAVAAGLLLGSPGPAPLALAATGATFGSRRGLPFLGGILLGLAVAVVAAATGLAVVFQTWPKVRLLVQLVGAIYIAYVAWRIASAPVLAGAASEDRCPRLVDGFILNLLNPKAYAAFLALFSQFLLPLDSSLLAYSLTGGVILVVAVLVDTVWLVAGGLLRPVFEHPRLARPTRVGFAALMLVAVGFAFTVSGH